MASYEIVTKIAVDNASRITRTRRGLTGRGGRKVPRLPPPLEPLGADPARDHEVGVDGKSVAAAARFREQSFAMEDRPSFTAETVALQRAFESARPPGQRLFSDPYAVAFLRPALRVLAAAARVPLLRGPAVGLYDAVAGPGPRPSAVARTRAIDDEVADAMASCGQCVLLGAGFDTRAHRLPALAGCAVLEVDHPATQAAKRAVVDRLELRRGLLTYVPVDFEVDDLASALRGAGFDSAVPAVFVWEGVTNYLTRAAVAATLDTVHDLAAAGSRLVLTYVDRRAPGRAQPVPRGPALGAGCRQGRGSRGRSACLPEEATEFFAEHGFWVRVDTSTYDAGRVWFDGRRERGSRLYRIAVADVVGAPAAR
jgi:methyltransferase (TIGR00027 family)